MKESVGSQRPVLSSELNKAGIGEFIDQNRSSIRSFCLQGILKYKEETREAHSGRYSFSLNLFVEQREIVIGIRTDNEELGWTTRDAPILKAIGKKQEREGKGSSTRREDCFSHPYVGEREGMIINEKGICFCYKVG